MPFTKLEANAAPSMPITAPFHHEAKTALAEEREAKRARAA